MPDEKDTIDTVYFRNKRINITSLSAERENKQYDCCSGLKLPQFNFNVVFKQDYGKDCLEEF